MFRDKMTQEDHVAVQLSCGQCGKPASSNHVCLIQEAAERGPGSDDGQEKDQ